MSKRTRVVVLVAASVVVVGLGTAGVASYVGGGLDNLLAGSAAGDLAYVPAGTEAVAFADVRRVMDSELGQKIQARLIPSADQNAGPLAQVGVDLRKDVDSIVVAAAPGAGAEAVLPLVLARGRFDFNKIEEVVGAHGGE